MSVQNNRGELEAGNDPLWKTLTDITKEGNCPHAPKKPDRWGMLWVYLIGLSPIWIIGGIIAIAILLDSSDDHSPPEPTALTRGVPERVSARTAFTFWESNMGFIAHNARYAVLTSSEEGEILEGFTVRAPEGITVEKLSLGITREEREAEYSTGTAVRTTTTVTYEGYEIHGTWLVTAGPECPAGEHEIHIEFPAARRICDRYGVAQPGSVGMTLRVHVLEDQ